MEYIPTILVGAFLSYIIYKILTVEKIRKLYKSIFKKFRWRQIPLSIITLCCVFSTSFLLIKINHIFSFSWLNLLGQNGGNLLVTGNTGGTTSNTSTTTTTISLSTLLITIAVPLMLLIAIPFLAWSEEDAYRKNSENRTMLQKTINALKFGLAHMVVGVPLGVGLALAIGGGYFTYMYMEEYKKSKDREVAVLSSTMAHSVYNYMAISIFILALLLSYFLI